MVTHGGGGGEGEGGPGAGGVGGAGEGGEGGEVGGEGDTHHRTRWVCVLLWSVCSGEWLACLCAGVVW